MDKQKNILNSALKLFVEYGFHGTPTSKIAKEAGVATGTLFHYYKTKDELISALYIDVKSNLKKEFGELNLEKDYKLHLKTIYLDTINWALKNKIEFEFIQQFNASPYFSLISSDELKLQAKPHLDVIELGIKNEELKTIPVNLLFLLINNHLFAVTQYLNSQEFSSQTITKTINETFDLLWCMISNNDNKQF